ncbi:hypothetical protein FSP39_002952 [Pinctada imbricata]|uniref:DUF7869 domain-containing protein n=1 Tax=Pinctada imbricata TaxID=66713 RepID=A0AA88YPS8_PINIB|nr:hypothetical protein FSP39_002952 [Pinctada imbricata]
MILNESQSFDECPVIFDGETLIGDPDVVLIHKTKEGCGCKRKCFDMFTENEIYQHRLSMRELDKFEKEALLLGKLTQSEIRGTNRCKLTGERQRQNFNYSFNQNAICETAFLLFHDIGNKAFKNLKQHYKENGIESRVHGHKGRRAPNSFPFEVIENVVLYIKNHADENGLPMPAAPRGRNEIPPIYLPSYETKTSVHKQYVISCGESRHVGLTLFKNIRQHTLPHIQIMKPRSDLCFKCQQHREQISAAVTENEKLAAISAFTEHIQQAQNERDFYNSSIRKSKDKLSAVNFQPGHYQPNSSDLIDIHYIFDYSQLFLLPNSSQQTGATYFVKPRRIQCFGICNSAVPIQSNFLLDENETIGKDGSRCHGPNSVISMLHEYLRTQSYGEKGAQFHCDNCAGQNKNKTMLHYLSWRCAKGFNDELNMHFMIVGHTKSMCDGCFDLARIKYIRSECHCVSDLENTIDNSASRNEVIHPPFPWYDWDSFFNRVFKGLKGISKFHHFRFTNELGNVYARETTESTEQRFDLKRPDVNVTEFLTQYPSVLTPAGLSADRQSYLYRNVRQFVRDSHKDELCPRPL